MADTLTQLVAKVQAQLGDNGTLFTTATITAAARQALDDINTVASFHAATLITTIADQHIYELNDYDAAANGITNVLLQGTNEDDTPLPFDAYVEDDRWFFRLHSAQPAGMTLVCQYTKPHTITGLDGALDSNLSDPLNTAAINGSCYYAAITRAAIGIEANNVETAVAANWMKLAGIWADRFNRDLRAARIQPTAKAEPSIAAWNDPQHDPEYP